VRGAAASTRALQRCHPNPPRFARRPSPSRGRWGEISSLALSLHSPIDNGRRRNHMPETLRGDGRFAKRSRRRQQGRRRAKRRRRGGAPGGAPPSASPSAAGEMRRGDAAPEAQKVATPTAWRGICPAPPGAPLPSLLGSNSFLAFGHSPAASTQLGRARVARTVRHGLLAGAARDSFSPRAGRRMG
jgi:hypothetical protein